MAVLGIIFNILLLSNLGFHKDTVHKAIGYSTKAFKTLINIELFCLAFFSIPFVMDDLKLYPSTCDVLLNFGLIFNETTSDVKKAAHTLFLCLIVASGQFVTAAKLNFRKLPSNIVDEYERSKSSQDSSQESDSANAT